MTYLEIIKWIESNVLSVYLNPCTISYLKEDGALGITEGKDLISIVLEINGKELVK